MADATRVENPLRFYMSEDTYVTRRDGELLMVRHRKKRQSRSTSALSIGIDLLSDAFRKRSRSQYTLAESTAVTYSTSSSSESSDEDQRPPKITRSLAPPRSDTPNNAEQGIEVLVPSDTSFTMTGAQNSQDVPPAGIYKKGDKQLVLLPLPLKQHGPQAQQSTTVQAPGDVQQVPPGYFINSYGFLQLLPPNLAVGFCQPQHLRAPTYANSMVFAPIPHGGRVVSGMDATSSVRDNEKIEAKIDQPTCAGCGRVRSRRFQHNNPVSEGEKPVVSFCRKCQKLDTSESVRSSDEVEVSGIKLKSRIARKKRSKKISIKKPANEDGASSDAEIHITHFSKKIKNNRIIVDESDDDRRRRHSRVRVRVYEYPEQCPDMPSRHAPSSPPVYHRAPAPPPVPSESSARSSSKQSTSSYRPYAGVRHISPNKDYFFERDYERARVAKEIAREREQQMPPPLSRQPPRMEYARQRSVRHEMYTEDEDVHSRGRSTVPQKQYEYPDARLGEVLYEKPSSRQQVPVALSRSEQIEVPREEDVRDERFQSSLKKDSPERRERYRYTPSQSYSLRSGRSRHDDPPFVPGVPKPTKDDDRVVVTERWVYRPRELSDIGEDIRHRRTPVIDRNKDFDNETHRISEVVKEVEDYFDGHIAKPPRQAPKPRKVTRTEILPGRYPSSSPSVSSNENNGQLNERFSSRYDRESPRERGPPSPIKKTDDVGKWHTSAPWVPSSSVDSYEPVVIKRSKIEKCYYPDGQRPEFGQNSGQQFRRRGNSNHRQPSVREATDSEGDTVQDLTSIEPARSREQEFQKVKSRQQYREHSQERTWDLPTIGKDHQAQEQHYHTANDDASTNVSGTDRTIEVERDFSPDGSRHVTFRSSDSFAPVDGSWEVYDGSSFDVARYDEGNGRYVG